jgi:hypothetical protein
MFKTIFAAGVAAASIAAPAMAQVTSVSQLKDVQPTEWSYAAISNLVSRYGCVAGYPSGEFKAGQPASRAELAALVSACIDRISEFQSAQDAQIAAALKAQAAKWNGTAAKVAAIELKAERKAQEVGSYAGAGLTLTRQGVDGNGYTENRTIGGATIQGRFPVANALGGEISARPYFNFAGSPAGQIGAGAGILATYDKSIASATLADGSKVSKANIYFGGGGQFPLVNGTGSNFQSTIGQTSQTVFVAGIEGRVSDSFVLFADIKFPTKESGVNGTAYAPVGVVGAGFKF